MNGALHTLPPLEPGTRALVLGLGRTGLSCARYLRRKGLDVRVADTRSVPPGAAALREQVPDAQLCVGAFASSLLDGVAQVLISPGLSLREPIAVEAARRGLPVVGDIELFARAVRAPVAAITGSNGKSTTTMLLGEMARIAGRRVSVGGNLGDPALDLLDPAVELYVLELSSFQLETTDSLRPAVAVVLNVSPDHLDRHDSLEDYAAAKARVFRHAEVAVVNLDDPRVVAMPGGERRAGFTLGEPGPHDYGLRTYDGTAWLCAGTEPVVPVGEMALAGRHNLANGLAALAMADAMGLPRAAAREALCTFGGLAHRTQLVAEVRGVRYYDDSKGTNVGATIAALEGFEDGTPARTVLIAGGDGKGQDFSALGPVLARTARCVVLIGRDAGLIEAVLGPSVARVHAADMAEAVSLAARHAVSGDRVLLSPACASFDMFRNYEHRGEVFAQAVRGLGA